MYPSLRITLFLPERGFKNATKVSADAVNDKHEFKSANINFTSGVKYTASVFVKSSGYDFAYIKFASTASVFNEDYAWFNISDGAKGTIDSDVTAIIEPYGNDWYRITASRTALATGSGKIFFGIGEVDNTPSFMGDGTSGAEFLVPNRSKFLPNFLRTQPFGGYNNSCGRCLRGCG